MADGRVEYEITADHSGFSKGINVVKGLAIGAAAAVSAAFTKVVKEALSQYAEYEQLVGGVETLFKESADTVQQYAANAYQTAGLSANEYMTTVTSFSASLLQSLGGDTAEAARMADMAITDMADNANKMGSDMQSIQDAYQGFAKQNYTMLDNLKLGYGDTKQEMERLIDDANKLREAQGKTADLTIDSYADIVEAIHEVQTEMGITGTTAKEASTTIQGSLSMTKAAWANLLTGLGDVNADIGQLVQNFMSSLSTLLTNVTPILQQIISAFPAVIQGLASALMELAPTVLSTVGEIVNLLIDLIIQSLPVIIEAGLQLIMALVQGLVENAANLAEAAVEIVTTLATFLAENIDQIITAAITLFTTFLTALLEPDNITALVEAAVQFVVALVEGIIKAIPQLLVAAFQLITSLMEALGSAVVQMLQMGGEWISNLISGIANKIGEVVSTANQLWNQAKAELMSAVGAMLQAGVEWISNLIQGIRNKIGETVQAGRDLVEGVKNAISSAVSSFRSIGSQLMEGLRQGIANKVSSIISAAKGAVQDAIQAAKNLLGIASPSKVFRVIGQYIDEGLAAGIDDEALLPEKAIKRVVETEVDIGNKGQFSLVSMFKDLIQGMTSSTAPAFAAAPAQSASNYSFTVDRLADQLVIREDADIDRISTALFQRFTAEKRGRGLY